MAKIDKSKTVPTPTQYRHDLEKLAKTLRAAIELAAKAFPPEYQIRRGKDSWFGEKLKLHLKETEKAINWTGKHVRKASRRHSRARIEAVDSAILLLKKYGKRRPGCSRVGPLHELARKLLGNDQADLFDYFKRRLELLTLFELANRTVG